MNRLCGLLSLVVIASGCGNGNIVLPTAPVAGTATYQGKPLCCGRIIFFHPSGHAKSADIVADGVFNLDAFQGKNQVAVECFGPNKSTPTSKGGPRSITSDVSLIPSRYAEFSTSGLTFDVKPGETNRAEFALKN